MLNLVRGEVGAVVANQIVAHGRHLVHVRIVAQLWEDVTRPLDAAAAAAAPHAVGEPTSCHHLYRSHLSVRGGSGDVYHSSGNLSIRFSLPACTAQTDPTESRLIGAPGMPPALYAPPHRGQARLSTIPQQTVRVYAVRWIVAREHTAHGDEFCGGVLALQMTYDVF